MAAWPVRCALRVRPRAHLAARISFHPTKQKATGRKSTSPHQDWILMTHYCNAARAAALSRTATSIVPRYACLLRTSEQRLNFPQRTPLPETLNQLGWRGHSLPIVACSFKLVFTRTLNVCYQLVQRHLVGKGKHEYRYNPDA